jgi:hypothetical protein
MRQLLKHPGYFATEDGHIVDAQGVQLPEMKHPYGHLVVQLRKKIAVHGLVAQAYLPPPRLKYSQVRHLDGNKENNAPGNLAWKDVEPSRFPPSRDNRKPPMQAPPRLGFIYFIGCDEVPAVKIGWSLLPEERLKHLQIAFPYKLRLLQVQPGTFHDEKNLHTTFAQYRLEGEWFARSPALEKLICQTVV